MPRWRSSIAEITADTHSSKNSLRNLGGKVCVCFVVIIYIEIVCIDVAAASDTSDASDAPISITSWPIAIVNKYNLLADNPLRVGLIAVWTLADARIVQENKRALAL